MLYIQKKKTPAVIRRKVAEMRSNPLWKKASESDTNAIRKNWFDQLPKADIREALLEEQHYLCAYCMKKIENDGLHTTIEHVVPLSKNKEKSLDYQNMLLVCKGGSDIELEKHDKAKGRVLCCDGSKHDETEMVLSPYDRDMMNAIRYYRDGRIYFKDSPIWSREQIRRIQKDIENVLCLNGRLDSEGLVLEDTATQLVKGRKDAYKQAEAIIERMKNKGRYTSAQLQRIIDQLQNSDRREAYAGVILFVLKQRQKRLLAQKK